MPSNTNVDNGIKQDAKKNRNRRSRFTSSKEEPLIKPQQQQQQQTAQHPPVTVLPPAVSRLRARFERKRTVSFEAPTSDQLHEKRSHQDDDINTLQNELTATQNLQQNQQQLGTSSKVQPKPPVTTNEPAPKRRRMSRFGHARPSSQQNDASDQKQLKQKLPPSSPSLDRKTDRISTPELPTTSTAATALDHTTNSEKTQSTAQPTSSLPSLSTSIPSIPSSKSTSSSVTPLSTASPSFSSTLQFNLNAIPIAPPKTLSINRKVDNKKKVETVLKISEKDLLDTNPESNPFFDPKLKKPLREARPLKKEFNFIDKGSISKKAEYDRECSTIQARRDDYTNQLIDVKKTVNSNLPVLPPLAEDMLLPSEKEQLHSQSLVPNVEWWDSPFLKLGEYGVKDSNGEKRKEEDRQQQREQLKDGKTEGDAMIIDIVVDKDDIDDIELIEERITHYVHHPPAIESAKPRKAPPEMKLMLTKTEMKKLRRQRRSEALKEEQEMIAAGLLPPPPPKVKLSNMMRVLTTETSVDPTKVEAEVRRQVEQRRLKHEADNAARQRSAEERREQRAAKRDKDRSQGLHVGVFRVLRANNAAHRFKVDRNAKQLNMSGVLVLFRSCNVVVVEGGEKALRKYKALMLRRIDWSDDGRGGKNKAKSNTNEENTERNSGDNPDQNNVKHVDETNVETGCVLVWEGVIASTSFSSFQSVRMNDEEECRAFFKSHHVEHYWDLCLQASPLGNDKLGVRQL